jgi:hypothetical protein
MGGSRGGIWKDADPDKLAQKIRKAEFDALDAGFQSEINAYLDGKLAILNNRDVDAVGRILDEIVSDLGDEVEGKIDLLFGGSVAKHTYVDGMSDVDALVLFDRTDMADCSPVELREVLATIMRERYGKDNVTVGNLAVTAQVQDHTIQLLPALRTSAGYRISGADGTTWASIHPESFTERLTAANKQNGGKLVPTIKLVKAIIDTLPKKQQLSGYHTESLALRAFDGYDGPRTPKAMVAQFFERASALVRKPITDPSGQSAHVDDYLGVADSVARRTISLAMGRITRRIRNADGMHSLDQWRAILGDA